MRRDGQHTALEPHASSGRSRRRIAVPEEWPFGGTLAYPADPFGVAGTCSLDPPLASGLAENGNRRPDSAVSSP